MDDLLSPPRTGTGPRPRGTIKRTPGDFQVIELASVEPDGAGAHLWLEIEREDMNTAFAARLIARAAGCREGDVGYAGLKDRHARTRQWFSVPAAGDDDALAAGLEAQGLHVVARARHGRKLRRGTLAGNRFRIRVALADGPPADLDAALERIRREGVANYFGPQRFGRDAANLERARAMLCAGERVRERHRRGLYLSAARSALFNRVLAVRVCDGTWNRLLPGEAVLLAGTASHFVLEAPDDDLERRRAAFDVHPSGPLWGRGGSPATGTARKVELAALAGESALMSGIEAAGAQAARRALRVPVHGLEAEPEAGAVTLAFDLPAGAYATVVLAELFDLADAGVPEAG